VTPSSRCMRKMTTLIQFQMSICHWYIEPESRSARGTGRYKTKLAESTRWKEHTRRVRPFRRPTDHRYIWTPILHEHREYHQIEWPESQSGPMQPPKKKRERQIEIFQLEQLPLTLHNELGELSAFHLRGT
jgi:hypothetical protein